MAPLIDEAKTAVLARERLLDALPKVASSAGFQSQNSTTCGRVRFPQATATRSLEEKSQTRHVVEEFSPPLHLTARARLGLDGHSTITMTMRYAHLSEDIGDDMIQRLAPRSGALKAVAATGAQHMDSTWFNPKSKTAS